LPKVKTTVPSVSLTFGAKVVCHSRKVIFQMAEVAVPREVFREILQAIECLRIAKVASE